MSQDKPEEGFNDDPLLPISDVFGDGEGAFAAPAPKLEGYDILHKIGEAGQGQVWCAIQQSTQRKVAIKVPRFQGFGARKAFRRFEREVQVVARLKHPHIARVYDSGLNRGLYYYTMEYIEGRHLDRYIKEQQLSQEAILKLMRLICLAVQYAHQNAVIHRDLKPSNILVTADGQPHIVDFGLAKGLNEEDLAVTVSMEDQPAGTPAYMSPEQAGGRHHDIDTRTDIYSLGVILYQLLTGTFPHDLSGGRLTVLNRIASEPIVRPQQACAALDKELGYILQKALAEEPQRRYASAQELAQDIQNYLDGKALIAGPESMMYVARKYIQRHKVLVFGTLAGIIVLVVGLIATSFLYVQAETARQTTAETLERERRQYYAHTIQLAQDRIKFNDFRGVRKMLEDTDPALRNWEWGYLMKQCQLPEKAFDFNEPVETAEVSKDGQYLLLAEPQDKTVSLLRTDDASVLWTHTLKGHIPEFVQADFDPAGHFAVVASGMRLTVFEIPSGAILYESRDIGYLSCCVRADDGMYAGTFDGQIQLFDPHTWQVRKTIQLDGKISHLAVCVKADCLAAISGNRTVTIHDPETLAVRWKCSVRDRTFQDVLVASKPADLILADGYGYRLLGLGQPLRMEDSTEVCDHQQEVISLALSDDGSRLITGGLDGMAYVYAMQTQQRLGELYHDSAVRNALFLPSGEIMTIGSDGSVKRWSGVQRKSVKPDRVLELPESVSAWWLDIAGDGQHAAFFSWGCPQIMMADLRAGKTWPVTVPDYSEEIKKLTPQAFFRPGTSEFVIKILDTLRVYDVTENGLTEVRRFPLPESVFRTAMDPKGRFVACSNLRSQGILVDLDTGKVTDLKGSHINTFVTVSADGARVAFFDKSGQRVVVWDSRTGGMIGEIHTGFHGESMGVALHPSEPLVAAGSEDGIIRVWNIHSGEVVAEMVEAGMGSVYSLQFSANGSRLISGTQDNRVRVWDWPLADALLTLEQRSSPVKACFSPSGLSIVSTDDQPECGRVFNAIHWQQ